MGDEQDVLDLLAGVAGGQLGDDVIEQGDANEAAAAAKLTHIGSLDNWWSKGPQAGGGTSGSKVVTEA